MIRDESLNFNDFTSNNKIGCHTWWVLPLNQKEMEIQDCVECHEAAVKWFCEAAREECSSALHAYEGLLDGNDDLYVPGNLPESMKKMAAHFGDAHMKGVQDLLSNVGSMVKNSAREGGTEPHKVGMDPDIPSMNDLLEMLKKVGISETTQKALMNLDDVNVEDFHVGSPTQ